MNQDDLAAELFRLQKNQRSWFAASLFLFIALAAALIVQARELHAVSHRDTLTLRRLDIVDAKGTPRVILAAPAPAPTRFGRAGKRDGPVSGILIADATGTERGGYVTSDGADANTLLTLDAQGKQTFLVLAERSGPTLLRLWNADKGSVVMGVSDAAPFLNVKQQHTLFLSAPNNNPQSHDARALFK